MQDSLNKAELAERTYYEFLGLLDSMNSVKYKTDKQKGFDYEY